MLKEMCRLSRAGPRDRCGHGYRLDGDLDRCFFYDHEGNFIEGYYVVGVASLSAWAVKSLFTIPA